MNTQPHRVLIHSGLACLAAIVVALLTVPTVLASPAGAGKPSIRIVSPQSGASVQGSTVTVSVAVSNFKLVPPVYINPPKLPGDQGHIHYVLDVLSNFVPTRDATASLSHSWTNVSPGRHTLIAYLATSQHTQFPGTRTVQVPVTVVAAASAPSTTAVRSSLRTGGQSNGTTSMPRTGGGDAGRSSWSLPWLLVALAAIATSLGLIWRRMAFSRV